MAGRFQDEDDWGTPFTAAVPVPTAPPPQPETFVVTSPVRSVPHVPVRRVRAAWAALTVAVVGSAGVGACCYGALARMPLAVENPFGSFFVWAAFAGIAGIVVLAALAWSLVLLVSRGRTVIAGAALVTALVLPWLTGWVGVNSGLDVLSRRASAQFGSLGASTLTEYVDRLLDRVS